jgi:hypothetical protein
VFWADNNYIYRAKHFSQMKTYKLLLIVFGLSTIYLACKKDEGAISENIVGTWKASDSYIVTFDTIAEKDSILNTFAIRKNCEKDDLIRIQEDKKFFELNGPLLCDTTEQTEQLLGKWELINKNKTLRILSEDLEDTTDYNLLYIDKTTLKLSIENDTILNSNRYYTFERNQ